MLLNGKRILQTYSCPGTAPAPILLPLYQLEIVMKETWRSKQHCSQSLVSCAREISLIDFPKT
jgi:hypothetical protein